MNIFWPHKKLPDEEVYAAKHCRFERKDAESTFNRELEILSLCQSPYIIKLYGTYDFNEGPNIGRGFLLEYSERSLGPDTFFFDFAVICQIWVLQ